MATFGDYHTTPVYSGEIERLSTFIPMPDDTPLAVTIWLPRDRKPQDQLPILLSITRYWREMELIAPLRWLTTADALNPLSKDFKPTMLAHGYAFAYVDERGTGASYGTWERPWNPQAIADMYHIVDWLVQQSWALPAVAGMGVSYLGTTAELLAACGHQAVKGAIPKFNHPDPYTDITMPGGLYNRHFMSDWSATDKQLDEGQMPSGYPLLARMLIRGVMPIDGAQRREHLRKALAEHTANQSAHDLAEGIVCRDEIPAGFDFCMDDVGRAPYITQMHQNAVPLLGWASWLDAGTADAAIRRWLTFAQAKQVVIGAWDHGGYHHASPYQPLDTPTNPPPPVQWQAHLRFFDEVLKGADNGWQERTIHYYVMGAEEWRKDHEFPPAATTYHTFYLGVDGQLNRQAPIDAQAARTYTVDLSATTGGLNRWWELHTLTKGTFVYNDRRAQSQHLLCYESEILTESVEIIGYVIIQLDIVSTHTDGAFIVYLEDVAPDGHVTYITEGALRAIHRHIAPPESAPYAVPESVPYHTYRKADASPLVVGELATLHFAMHPTAVRIAKGHRLRIALAGHDADTFDPVPSNGVPEIQVLATSCVRLPLQGILP